jgi:hypothetical protein
MPAWDTTDDAVTQLCEKYRSVHKNLHMVFIDLEMAYDRAQRMKGMPDKYVKLVQGLYSRCRTQVRSVVGTTTSFEVAVCLHQGSALSPYLFLMALNDLTADIQ